MVCDLSTPENKRRDNTCSAEESDYLRLVGYGGLVDSMYCGHKEKVSIVVGGTKPLALMFKSQQLGSEKRQLNLPNLFGFQCKLVCKAASDNTSSKTTTTISSTKILHGELKSPIFIQCISKDIIILGRHSECKSTKTYWNLFGYSYFRLEV